MALFPQLAVRSAPTSHSRAESPTLSSPLWYRVVLGDALIGARQIPVIREHFADARGAASWADGACLFLSGRHAARIRAGEEGRAVPAAIFFSPERDRDGAAPYRRVWSGAEPAAGSRCARLLIGSRATRISCRAGSADELSRHDQASEAIRAWHTNIHHKDTIHDNDERNDQAHYR